MELEIHFYKDHPDDPLCYLPTTEDDSDASVYEFEYVAGGNSRSAWRTKTSVYKNERGQWDVAPSALRSMADYMFRQGREHQAKLFQQAVNYKA